MIQIRAGGKSGEAATLDSPLEHLSACHRRIEERLATLERAGEALESRREEALAAIAAAFAFMDSSGALHTRDEEESLFPRLERKVDAGEAALLRALEDEHRQADRLYAQLRQTVGKMESGAPAADEYRATAAALCALYRQHIATEDSRLVETSRKALAQEDLAAISAEMKRRRGLA